MSNYRRLEFSAYCQTQFGEYVCICGNLPQLGYWNPMKALRLRTEESYYPIWKSFDSIFVLQNRPIEFKIVVINSKNEFKWENTMQNRIIVPEIDAYVKLTANEFETYEIFPFCDGDGAVRRGLHILDDLSSDGSSSISFKSNYKFYEYFDRKSNRSQHGVSFQPQNTSTFRDLTEFQGSNQGLRFGQQFVTYYDSLTQLQHNQTNSPKKQGPAQNPDCFQNRQEQAESHSTSSDKPEFDEEKLFNENWVVYRGGIEGSSKKLRNSGKKVNYHKLNSSLNKMLYSNSSQSLSIGREQ